MMTNFLRVHTSILASAFATAMILAPIAASAAVSRGDVLGTTEKDITAALEQQGYTVKEIEFEDGVIEAEIIAKGTEMEIEVDAKSGQVLEVDDD